MANITFPSEKLKGVKQLLKESWVFYRTKIKTILGILIIPIGFDILKVILINFLSLSDIVYSFWYSLILAFSSLISIFLWLWVIPSLLYSFKENTAFKESYRKGIKVLSSYIWVYFLLTVIIVGGFLLFIIPGILFFIWLSLAIFIFISEEKKGFNALFRSKQLVKGNFWGVLWRFFILVLIMGAGSILSILLISFGAENKQISEKLGEFLGYLLQLFILPLFLIYGFLIYNNLKEIKTEISYEEPSLRKKLKYLIPGILGTLILGLLVSVSFFNIFWGRDIPPIDDSDLWLSKIEIPKEENAFYYFDQVDQKSYLPSEKIELFEQMVRGEAWDSDFAQELIENNQEVFELFEKAIELPYFQIPDFQDPKTIGPWTIIPGLSGLRNIARLNSIKVNYLLTQSKEKEALDLTVKIIKMGQMTEDMPRPALISYLVGMAIKETGLQKFRIIIANLTLSPELLKNYIVELERFKGNEEGLIKAMKMGYIDLTNTKSLIDAAFTGDISKKDLEKLEMLEMEETSFEMKVATKLNYLYKPNQTQKIFAEHYRDFIHNINKNCYEMKIYETKMIEVENRLFLPSHPIKMLFTENVIGKIFHDIAAVSLYGVFNRKCSEDLSIMVTQLLLAMKASQMENGNLPATLDELVPQYLSQVPKDPFDGKPIRYSPEEKIIYSPQGDILLQQEGLIFQIEF